MGIAFIHDLRDWRDVTQLLIGASNTDRTVAHVGIETSAGLRLRIDIGERQECACFQDVRLTGSRAYIGYGSRLFVIDMNTLQFSIHDMQGYFAHLYTAGELGATAAPFAVLASSASELLAFDEEGGLIWKTGGLGIDGVVVNEAFDGVLRGEGEWDPPDGWRPLTLLQASGEHVKSRRKRSIPAT
jgi:hypothetical protein